MRNSEHAIKGRENHLSWIIASFYHCPEDRYINLKWRKSTADWRTVMMRNFKT